MDHEVTGVPEEAEHPVRRGANTRAALGAYARTPAVLIAGTITLAVAIGVVLWLLLRGGGEEAKPSQRAPATAASVKRLDAFASSVGHPIYWVGSQPRSTYELSRTKDGRVYIRYLPAGVKLGNSNPNYLTVGTYPQPHAFATLRATAKKQGVQTIHLAGGGLAFQYKSRPTSVYLAPGETYEVTRTKDGSVYIRYLPQGVPVGVKRPDYLTIGTYPQKRALAILKATAAKNRVPTMNLDGGGLAFVDKKHPTSVYVAYPNVDVQVEVYDPAPARARQLVASGQIAPVR